MFLICLIISLIYDCFIAGDCPMAAIQIPKNPAKRPSHEDNFEGFQTQVSSIPEVPQQSFQVVGK